MKQKSRLNSVKGYFQIDIAFAILVFFLLFFLVYTLNKDHVSSKETLIDTEKINMNARDICNVLISTPGSPTDWESLTSINDTKVFGLKNSSSYGIDSNKLTHFNTTNYFKIKNRFDEDIYLNIRIVGVNSSTEHLNFGTSIEGKHVRSSSYNCYSIYNSEPVKIIVEAWK